MLTTLAVIAPFAASGGGVVFDYVVPPASLAPPQRAVFERWLAVAAVGEPFRGFFEPSPLVAAVQGLGFREVATCHPTN